jgi:putative oxidoreductase
MNPADLGLLILRVVVGVTFAAHGAQKAFGWWQGSGWAGWHAVVERMGFRPVPLFAAISIAAELGGGLALAVGFLTPLAATLLIGQSTVIIGKAHWPRGFWNRDNGFEFPLSLVAGAIAILLIGPGAVSFDEAAGLAFGDTVRLSLLVVGLLGGALSILVSTLARRRAVDGPASAH